MDLIHSTLRRIDLNLLLFFDAIYCHRSVRMVVAELIINTSALSHVLNHLRRTLNDLLFDREGCLMYPRVYAGQLAPTMGSALVVLNQ